MPTLSCTPLGLSLHVTFSGALATLVHRRPRDSVPASLLNFSPHHSTATIRQTTFYLCIYRVSPTRACELHGGICVFCVLLLTYCQQDTAIKAGAQKYWLNDEVVMKVSLRYSRNLVFQLLCPCGLQGLSNQPPQNWVSSVTWGHDARRLWWHQDIICKEGGTRTSEWSSG